MYSLHCVLQILGILSWDVVSFLTGVIIVVTVTKGSVSHRLDTCYLESFESKFKNSRKKRKRPFQFSTKFDIYFKLTKTRFYKC